MRMLLNFRYEMLRQYTGFPSGADVAGFIGDSNGGVGRYSGEK